MARTPTDADIAEFAPSEVVEKNLAEMKPLVDANAMALAILSDKEDAFLQLGRIESAVFFATVAEKMIAETAINLRNGKKYKGLPFTDENGNLRHVATFEEFCQYKLGKSYRRVHELMSNYQLLGSELYEQAERLGFRQRDYNALKALPEDDRKLITQAMDEENFQKALDLMSMMAAKHQEEKQAAKAEKEATDAQIADLKNSLEDTQRLIQKKNDKIDELDKKLTRKIIDDAGYPQGHQELESLHTETQLISAKVTASLRSRISQLYGAFDGDLPRHLELAAAQSIGLIITAAYELAADLNLSPVLNPETAADDEVQQTLRNMAALEAAGGDPTQFLDEQGRADLARLKGYTQTEIEG
jgi:hypothetical protein